MPTISVVMPVFNCERFVGRAIESILAQTFKRFEFIVIDDGSTDGSRCIIERYARKDRRIVVVSRENRGLVVSLNEGIEAAGGEWIARMDADDIAHPDRLKIQLRRVHDTSIVLCGTAMRLVGAKRRRKVTNPERDPEIRAVLPLATPFFHPTVMVRRSILKTCKYSEAARHVEDYDLWTRCADRGELANVNDVLLDYRVHERQVSTIHARAQAAGTAEISLRHLRTIGILTKDDQIELHRKVIRRDKASNLDELSRAGAWLQALRAYFPPSADVDAVYQRVWRQLCAVNEGLGRGLWGVYRSHRFVRAEFERNDALIMLVSSLGIGMESRTVRRIRTLLHL